MMQIRKVLCPVDFSPSSDHALEYAVAFAGAHRAELLLVHVVHPLAYGVGAEGVAVDAGMQLLKEMETSCADRLHEVAESVKGGCPSVSEFVVTGVPFLEIIQLAKAQNADLIVMGTHGRSGLAHMLIGSVAERVVRKAPCPVLTVKHPEHDFVMP